MRKRGAGFFVGWFAVNNNRVRLLPDLTRFIPHFFHKRAGSIVGCHVEANGGKFTLRFQGSTKGRNNYHVGGRQFAKRNQWFTKCVEQKANAPALQIRVHIGVMNYLAQEENALIRVFGNSPISNFDGVFHTITKPEMPRYQKTNRPKIERCGCKVAFQLIFPPPMFFQRRNNGASVVGRNVK